MRETNGRQRRISTKLKAAAAALAAVFAVAAFGVNSAQAASTPGGSIETDFNYVGIAVTALGNDLNQLVLTPTTEDPAADPPAFLPPLKMKGTYDDANGNFTLPKATGFDFPKLAIEIEGAQIEAEIGLTEDAKGNFDDATGAMSVNPKISLTLGTDHLEDLPEGLPIQGEGPLKCQFAPLNVSLSTNAINWPSPGTLFTDMTSAAPAEGAVAGSWNTKPKVKALVDTNGYCVIIGSLLDPVGGLYLTNSSLGIPDMPAATADKPAPAPCPAGTTGTPGTPPDECKVPEPPVCAEGTTGTYPDCEPIGEPPTGKFTVSKVKISGPGKIKAGKKVKLKVKVTNSGDAEGTATVTLKSANKKVKLPKKVKVTIAPGKTATKTVTVKASKKAKGKAKITAKSSGKSAKKVLKVKASKKKRKK